MAEWRDVIAVSELEPGWVTPATLGARALAVFDTAEGVFVTSALCSHAGADLCHGYFDGLRIECPLHQGLFDVRNGKAAGAPAVRPIKAFETRVTGGIVQIRA